MCLYKNRTEKTLLLLFFNENFTALQIYYHLISQESKNLNY